MRVRVLTGRPGYPAGGVVDMEDAQAAMWLGRGDAELIERQVDAERATAEPQAETAVKHGRRGR